MLLLAVVEALVNLFGNYAVGFDHVRNIVGGAALGEVDLAVHAYVFARFVKIAVTHHKHFTQVHRLAAAFDHVLFEK